MLEATIYIALFSLLLGGMLPAAYQIIRSGDRDLLANALQEEAAFIDRKIYWALSGAIHVASPSPGRLDITRSDAGTDDPLVITAEGTAMTLARGRDRAVALNGDAFPVTNVVFAVRPSLGATSGVVTAQFLIAGVPFFLRYPLPRSGIILGICAP